MGYGDEILAAGQAHRLFAADPARRVGIFDRHARPRWHPIWDGNPILATPAAIAAGEPVHVVVNGPHCRPYIQGPFTAESGWTFNYAFRARDHVAQLYLTDEELCLGRQIRAHCGPYVLIDPGSKHANLRWPFESWARLVAARPEHTWVQHTWPGGPLIVPGVQPFHTTTFREACGLVASAAVYLRGESGMLHAAAALGVPTVAIWGGCMAFEVLGGYATQVAVGVHQPPCGRYLPCAHCAEIMAGITVEEVLAGLDKIGVE